MPLNKKVMIFFSFLNNTGKGQYTQLCNYLQLIYERVKLFPYITGKHCSHLDLHVGEKKYH